MTSTDLNIAIVKSEGWMLRPEGWIHATQLYSLTTEQLPKYSSDLNLMRELELDLDDSEYHKFTIRLNEIAWREYPHETNDQQYKNRLRVFCSGTAAQRAEAYAKVKGIYHE